MIDHRTRPRVLVVEDNDILLATIRAVFEAQGLDVVEATSGETALLLLREQGAAIDWLFTDICLPGIIDGWTVADEYRMSHPLRPVVYASTGAADRRRTVAGSVFVEKPMPMGEIARVARMMMAESAAVGGAAYPRQVSVPVSAREQRAALG